MIMEIGETFEQTAKRETYEETGLDVGELKLFGMYSGERCFVQYPNNDQVYSVQIIFTTTTVNEHIIPDTRFHIPSACQLD